MKNICAMLIALCSIAAGCRSAGRDPYDFGSTDRGSQVRTISATMRVALEVEPGQPIELQGIMVAELPHAYRLQLWKLRAPVLDITRTRRGTWILNRLAEEELADAQALRRGDLQRAFTLVAAGFRAAHQVHGRGLKASECIRTRTAAGPAECCADGGGVTCTVWRKGGGILASAVFTHFRQIGPGEWPTEVSLRSEFGSLLLSFDQVDVNEPLGVDAFRPPRQAQKAR